ncbi:hypothetical protein NKJ91_14040 [Mesorhizobium sp. M0040]
MSVRSDPQGSGWAPEIIIEKRHGKIEHWQQANRSPEQKFQRCISRGASRGICRRHDHDEAAHHEEKIDFSAATREKRCEHSWPEILVQRCGAYIVSYYNQDGGYCPKGLSGLF